MKNNMEKATTGVSSRNITIRTQQGKVEINGTCHKQPGVCPHCHRAMPLSSVVFKKIDVNNNVAAFIGNELSCRVWDYNGTAKGSSSRFTTDQTRRMSLLP